MIDLFNEAKSQPEGAAHKDDLFTLEQVKKIVNLTPMAVSITDDKGVILYINPFFSQTTGYTEQDLIGKNHSILSDRKTPRPVYQELWQRITAGKSWRGQLLNRKKTGESYLAEVQISPLNDSNAEATLYFLGVHRDISADHALEMQQSNNERVFSSILNSVPTAVALLNEHDEVILDNLAYKALASDIRQEPAKLVIGKIKQQLNVESLHSSTVEGQLEKNVIIEFNQSGHTRHFVCRLSGLDMQEENVTSYFSPIRNPHLVLALTEFTREQKRIEQQRLAELQRSTVETEMMHAMQETMHAVLHQLQEPVNMIESAVALLQKRHASCTGIDPMIMALDAGKEAVKQLHQALPERAFEAKQSVNVNQLVHEVSQMKSEQLMRRSIELRLSLLTNLPAIIAQPSRLRVALKQLLENAIEAIDYAKCERREILISTSQVDGDLVVCFDDSGPGIKKSDALLVFQPFYSTKPVSSEGSRGIGLSIVQQVINEHCGTVRFVSSSLGGCCARMSLPRRQEV
ncbi:nitrogen fixation negative regulator NifL [Reinekea thalattae]|uniref:histidine kinase n=1 Tax=Reinekea thalattae TaxID=2593301 RepID=A0A5C8Z793_9GAMM|nr:nitrogen fixation negative regulator NifL [Reinekea thalattae]TXR53021.1 nitrogen fixation negative regulator NifL [Reinekea thalattae]